ncbi:hypothetical protein [Streptomyces tanashiensis]|uniref:hypothetical protein n=1 Tax=Streptomyces tanashiensis TaxID=67367 RepID=UPI001673288D|nr:hypothetical protein [Streptomyces tanashiensis]
MTAVAHGLAEPALVTFRDRDHFAGIHPASWFGIECHDLCTISVKSAGSKRS